MLLGYARDDLRQSSLEKAVHHTPHRARSPPAFPEAPPAIFDASRSVILCLAGSYEGCRVRKYAVVEPIMPPPVRHLIQYRSDQKAGGEPIITMSRGSEGLRIIPAAATLIDVL